MHEIEKRLPISPYDAEWVAVGEGKVSKLYRPVSHIELGVPWVFLLLHVVVFIKSFPFSTLISWLSRLLKNAHIVRDCNNVYADSMFG